MIKRILKDKEIRDKEVIIKELGEVRIENMMVEKEREGVIEMDEGCMWWKVRGEMVDKMEDIIERLKKGRIKEMKRVIIEKKGIEDKEKVMN